MSTLTKQGKERRRVTPGTPIEDRLTFHRHVTRSGCWVPKLKLADNGYAVLVVDGRRHYAHRLSWEAFIGPIPDGLQIDHLCRNRACFNPAHLEPVTAQTNTLRSEAPGARAIRLGACLRGHSRADWGQSIAAGTRTQCRLCNIAYSRARNLLTESERHERAEAGLQIIDLDHIFRSKVRLRRLGLLPSQPSYPKPNASIEQEAA